jgi:hypothetical protein
MSGAAGTASFLEVRNVKVPGNNKDSERKRRLKLGRWRWQKVRSLEGAYNGKCSKAICLHRNERKSKQAVVADNPHHL